MFRFSVKELSRNLEYVSIPSCMDCSIRGPSGSVTCVKSICNARLGRLHLDVLALATDPFENDCKVIYLYRRWFYYSEVYS
jgi:hypothetical protein